MHRAVLDLARQSQARTRRADSVFVAPTTGLAEESLDTSQLVAVDDALTVLGTLAPELRQLVEMRFCAGPTISEISELIDRPVRSVERGWTKPQLLMRQLMGDA